VSNTITSPTNAINASSSTILTALYNIIQSTINGGSNTLYSGAGASNYLTNVGNTENRLGAYGLGSSNKLHVVSSNTTGVNYVLNEGASAGAIANDIRTTNGDNVLTASNGNNKLIAAQNTITASTGNNNISGKTNYIQGNGGSATEANYISAVTGWNYLYANNGNGNRSNRITANTGYNVTETYGTGNGSYNLMVADYVTAGNVANWIKTGTGDNYLDSGSGTNTIRSTQNYIRGATLFTEYGGTTGVTVQNTNGLTTNILRLSTRPFEWYMCNQGGSGITTSGTVIGNSTQVGGNFASVTTFGGASASSWNTTSAVFTAPTDGMYLFQFNIFHNDFANFGREIQMLSPALGGGAQYCIFNLGQSGGEASYQWCQTLWFTASQTAYFQNPSAISLQLYYANGHTNLRITRLY